MKLKVTKEVDTKGWTLVASLGEVFEELRGFSDGGLIAFADQGFETVEQFEERYPELVGIQPPYYRGDDPAGKKTIVLKIDLSSGKILNWPKSGVSHDFCDLKLVDTGRYEIRDEKGKVVAGYTGYVPGCLQIEDSGYGDYLEFRVDVLGQIEGWSFGQEEFDEIKEESEN